MKTLTILAILLLTFGCASNPNLKEVAMFCEGNVKLYKNMKEATVIECKG